MSNKNLAGVEAMIENKFIVIKREDFNKLPSPIQAGVNDALVEIEENRKAEGKTIDNTYLVINTDEKYTWDVFNIMRRHGHCKPEYSLENDGFMDLECTLPGDECPFTRRNCLECEYYKNGQNEEGR